MSFSIQSTLVWLVKAQIVEWALYNIFSGGPEFKSWLGRAFLYYIEKQLFAMNPEQDLNLPLL